MTKRTSAGGAATAGGENFHYRVASWVAVHILAEKEATPPWDLPTGTLLEWLRCETEQSVDDLMVGATGSGFVFAQIKHTVWLSKAVGSDLASALDQFVRQFIACQAKSTGKQTGDRPLSPQKDRLILITSSKSSKQIRLHLSSVLRRLRDLPQGQPLDKAALNRNERSAISIVRMHVVKSWQKALGTDPTEAELRQLLSLVHVQELDVDEGRYGEREAKTLMRTAVLKEPNEADTAWAQLITFCANLAASRSGTDRFGLRRALLNAGIAVKAPQSYRKDVERFREYSETTFQALTHLAEIRVGSAAIKIERPSTEVLRQAAERNSILVVGEPGAGKSGAIHDCVKSFRDEERDFVFIAADRLSAQSPGELRAEIGLDHEIVRVLRNWPGTKPAFLIIDALDAARGDSSGMMIRNLIREVIQQGDRWQVIVSIRKFDLRYGVEIKQLFAGSIQLEFQDAEFEGIRHLNIPHLSDEELDQIFSQSKELQALLFEAPTEIHELLRVPFNLKLTVELLEAGVAPDELTPTRTQLGLFEKYWDHRVIRKDKDRNGDAREAVLKELCMGMIRERVLRIDRSVVARPDTSNLLDDLLSIQILVEWQPSHEAPPNRYILAFSHNFLFDYATARLLLRGTRNAVLRLLIDDPDLGAIVIRPSLLLHFRYLWTVDASRRQFWDFVFRVIREGKIPEIAKLIGSTVAAEFTRVLSDLEPLCIALDDPNSQDYTVAVQALKHLAGALLTEVPGDSMLVGSSAGPWHQLLERVSRSLKTPVAYTARLLLSTICIHPEKFTPDQLISVGLTARRLLEFAWSHTPRDHWLVIDSLQGVCRTFESDPKISVGLIRRCMEPEHFSKYKFEEMPWLAREVKRLFSLDPDLVEEIYRIAFTYPETSTDKTSMGLSRILPLTSNRRQDYEMALYNLAEVFSAFLAHSPENATRALIAVIEAYVAQNHTLSSPEKHEETFDFYDRKARLLADYSAIWDAGDTYRSDKALKMLDTFQQYLEKLAVAEQPEIVDKRLAIIELLISENRLAILWRRILLVAVRYPSTLGKNILPFSWAIPIFTCFDTTTLAGDFLKAIFPTLALNDRKHVELTILSIPATLPASSQEAGLRIRNRLLGCLPNVEPVTKEAKGVLAQLRASNAIPSNDPPASFDAGWGGQYGEEEYLKDQGVPIDTVANRKIRELEAPVKEFDEKHLNSKPSLEAVSNVFVNLQKLHNALSRVDEDDVHPEQSVYAWDCLAAACARIATTDGLSCETPIGSFVKAVLLEASHHTEPVHDPAYDARFEDHPSWGRPAPRIEAANGLIVLAYSQDCAAAPVLKAIERLSGDPKPAVRYQTVIKLHFLYRTAPKLMWRLIEHISIEESNRGVLRGLLSGPIHGLSGSSPGRIAKLTKDIFDRVEQGPGAKKVRGLCAECFTGLHIWRDEDLCRKVVLAIAADPIAYPDEMPHLLSHLREPLTYGPTDPPDPNKDAVRRRVLNLLNRVLTSTRDALNEIQGRYSEVSFNDWPPQDQESVKSLVRLIDDVGMDLYISSGAYDGKKGDQAAEDWTSTRERSKRFYDEVSPLLETISDIGLPSVTHHLLQTLEFFIPIEPRNVFLYIGRVLRAGQKGGYQYESLAERLVVGIVERYLAEFRSLLRDDNDCRETLIEILDIFVQPGWPSARRLTYRLEEIFR